MENKDLTFRTALESEIPSLKRLAYKTWSTYQKALTPENWKLLEQNLSADKTLFDLFHSSENIVCESDGHIVGMAFLVSHGNPTEIYQENWSYIRFVTVHPDFQGKGIGRKLTERCISLAKKKGEKFIALHTSDMMQTAQNLYRSLGFHLIKDLPPRFGRQYYLFLLVLENDITDKA